MAEANVHQETGKSQAPQDSRRAVLTEQHEKIIRDISRCSIYQSLPFDSIVHCALQRLLNFARKHEPGNDSTPDERIERHEQPEKKLPGHFIDGDVIVIRNVGCTMRAVSDGIREACDEDELGAWRQIVIYTLEQQVRHLNFVMENIANNFHDIPYEPIG